MNATKRNHIYPKNKTQKQNQNYRPLIESMNFQDLGKWYLENISIKEKERDHFGEVFTPPDLIGELLDALPSKVWKNPHHTWLDPAAGFGNFHIFVYERLMRGLRRAFPSPLHRKRHILTKMLFFVEINPNNVVLAKRIFGPSANICCADFLQEPDKWSTAFRGRQQFDVVLGNPPFQRSKKETHKGAAGQNAALWPLFIKDILENRISASSAGGYLAFITPALWRRPEAALYSLMTRENHLIFLHIYGKQAGLDRFHAETRFDLFVIQKEDGKKTFSKDLGKSCTIIDETEKTHHYQDLGKWPFLPNRSFDLIESRLLSEPRESAIIYDSSTYDARHLSTKKTAKYRYPVVHTITKKGGLGIRWAEYRDSAMFGVPKVLLNFNEQQYPYNDFLGKYGMSQLTFGVPIKTKKEGDEMIRKITSPDFKEILKATKWSAFQTDYRMFKYLSI
jgi:hypothetical protein